MPVEQLRGALAGEFDWHALLPNPANGRAQRGSVAAMLVTTHSDARRYLDGTFGQVIARERATALGDYLCPDGRYRLGDIAGTVRPQRHSQSLIGVVRRQAAAAARREELTREQTQLMRELEDARNTLRAERETAGNAETRVRTLSELAHMLDEVEQRRREMRTLREAEEQAAVRLAAAGGEVDATSLEEQDARARWADIAVPYPALADPANLARARLTLHQSVADALARANEARERLSQMHTRLRSARGVPRLRARVVRAGAHATGRDGCQGAGGAAALERSAQRAAQSGAGECRDAYHAVAAAAQGSG